jgi:hypothetical protein
MIRRATAAQPAMAAEAAAGAHLPIRKAVLFEMLPNARRSTR